MRGSGYDFKITNMSQTQECDAPPTPMPVGGLNTYQCGPADGSPGVPLEVPESGCYSVEVIQLMPAEVTVYYEDNNVP